MHHVSAYETSDDTIMLTTCIFRALDLRHPFGFTPSSPYFNCEYHPDGQVCFECRGLQGANFFFLWGPRCCIQTHTYPHTHMRTHTCTCTHTR